MIVKHFFQFKFLSPRVCQSDIKVFVLLVEVVVHDVDSDYLPKIRQQKIC
jgi:hypothetical protein